MIPDVKLNDGVSMPIVSSNDPMPFIGADDYDSSVMALAPPGSRDLQVR